MLKTLRITRPDDWHIHFRDGDALRNTVPDTGRHFARALAMPNLSPALTTLDSLLAYHQRLIAAAKNTPDFEPYLTFYLNESVTPDDLIASKQYPFILGGKLYPAGVTTNSTEGVASIRKLYPQLEVMQQHNLVLQIHGETITDDIFDRERAFIETHLTMLIKDFPRLRIILEHISTQAAVDFIQKAPEHVAATITPHHLMFNRNQLLAGGIRPHYYCLPILKRERDQQALQQAAFSGHPRFFAGTDSAPHSQPQKENACGCAGVYSAPFAVAMYAQVFDAANQIQHLEAFLSHFGAAFYQLPQTNSEIELVRESHIIPQSLPLGNETVVPLAAGQTLSWRVLEKSIPSD